MFVHRYVGIAPQYLLRMVACQQDIEFTLSTAKIKLRQPKIHTSAIEHDNMIDLRKPVHQGRVSLGALRPAGDERILQPQMCATSSPDPDPQELEAGAPPPHRRSAAFELKFARFSGIFARSLETQIRQSTNIIAMVILTPSPGLALYLPSNKLRVDLRCGETTVKMPQNN